MTAQPAAQQLMTAQQERKAVQQLMTAQPVQKKARNHRQQLNKCGSWRYQE